MPDEIYEIIALAARYWFLFLMLLIAWRSYRWYVRDRNAYKKRLKHLPDAGFIGELIVLQGDDVFKRGTSFHIGREGVLGYLRSNDVSIPINGIANHHLWFSFDETDGLRVEPMRGRIIIADGKECIGKAMPAYLSHGSLLVVGEAKLRLRLFAGFEHVGNPVVSRMPFVEDSNAYAYTQAQPSSVISPRVQRMHEMEAWQTAMEDDDTSVQPIDDTIFYPPEMDDDLDESDYEPTDYFDYEDNDPDNPAYTSYEVPTTTQVFYPPVMDEDSTNDTDSEEYPPSLYVGEDEAAKAKRVLWDKYLKGGNRQ